jgi:hypothetical protein
MIGAGYPERCGQAKTQTEMDGEVQKGGNAHISEQI